jgi:DNA repair protein RadC
MNYQNIKIKTWAVEDQPQRKLISYGPSVLSDSELISIIIGPGNIKENEFEIAKNLLDNYDNNINRLSKCSLQTIINSRGMTHQKATKLLAALDLGRRNYFYNNTNKKISKSKDIFNIFCPIIGHLPHEEFWALYLNRANKIINKIRISQGGISNTVIDIRIILKHAIELLASGIILSHNHPSGNIQPSDPDKKFTVKIQNAANFMEIKLIDHVIISSNSYFSFSDEYIL